MCLSILLMLITASALGWTNKGSQQLSHHHHRRRRRFPKNSQPFFRRPAFPKRCCLFLPHHGDRSQQRCFPTRYDIGTLTGGRGRKSPQQQTPPWSSTSTLAAVCRLLVGGGWGTTVQLVGIYQIITFHSYTMVVVTWE